MKFRGLLFVGYVASVLFLLLYSYTQIDLSLTLSRFSVWQTFEKAFQYIGYFDRPLSTGLYLSILLLLFTFYAIFIKIAGTGKLSSKDVWRLICIVSAVLLFSYNAFSYDLFNYIFDAKIFTHYHLNPYLYKALDFPTDPMLSFMHWTHRTYPYGPVWLLATVPLSFAGFQYFLPTFFLFKLFTVACFLGTVYFLDKTLQILFPKERVFGLVLFALNPLVLIETLVSGHNDMFMMFLAVLAFYFLVTKRFPQAFSALILSIGVKFATAFLFPVFLYAFFATIFHKKFSWKTVFFVSAFLMGIAVIFAALRTTFQPWYILFALPFGAYLGRKYYIVFPTVILSLFVLLEYVPYLYTGNWNPPIPSILNFLTFSGILVSLVTILAYKVGTLLIVPKNR